MTATAPAPAFKGRDEMLGAAVLGRYRVVARLGQGGMGVVYLARAEGAAGFAKPVVVKRVHADLTGNPQTARLFVREAKILANLQHPNVASVIDFGEEAGAYMMVLEYVRAYDLGRWLDFRKERGERLPIACVLHIVIKVLEALEYAHSLKNPDGSALEIIHSDISPGNVLVDSDGQVKLLDFGIARMKGSSTQATDGKSIRGKFAYLPVEALDGSPPKITTDVYACAVTLYELLAGDNPFVGVDETRTVAKVISTEPPPPSTLRDDVPAELDAILARGMSKDLTKRFPTAKDFARELRKVQTIPEDEAVSMLAALTKGDYAAMPSKPGTSIAELEDAWRNPPLATSAATRAATVGVDPSAQAYADTQFDGPQRKRGRGALYVLAGALALVAVSGITLAVVLTRRAEADAPKIVLVERSDPSATATTTTATTTTTAASATADPPAGTASAGGAHPPSHGSSPAKPAGGGDPLSAALAKHQPAIEACFRDHATDLSGSPEVSVRFIIDREGAVHQAELIPASLTTTPLGGCILAIAKRTRFPAQSRDMTRFSIPLRAKKSG
jgi:serine/threonine-protein kinase